MGEYNREQLETLTLIRRFLSSLNKGEKERFKEMAEDYLQFREEIDDFLGSHFAEVCTKNCYESRLSACCSREGIITFFGDVAINAIVSGDKELDLLAKALEKGENGFKCVYLGKDGCIWRVKPIVCVMFLCDRATEKVFRETPMAAEKWKELEARKKSFTWPDQPVLFDKLEEVFLSAGIKSPLMYMHNSPGLLRVKKLAGLGPEGNQGNKKK